MSNLTRTLQNWGYDPIGQIDKGANENVILASSMESGYRVTIKIINQTNSIQELLDRELEISTLLQHPNIVQTLNVYQDSNYAFVVMEKMSTSLLKYMSQKGSLSEELCKKMFLQLTLALDYMHNSVGIAHGGITVSSVLLDADLNLKLADFSQSRHLQSSAGSVLKKDGWRCSSGSCHLNYIGPEVSSGHCYDDVKDDMFRSGIVLYFMLTNRFPRRNDDYGVDGEEICKIPVSLHCHQLLLGLLHLSPSMRFSSEKILASKWLKPSLIVCPPTLRKIVLQTQTWVKI